MFKTGLKIFFVFLCFLVIFGLIYANIVQAKNLGDAFKVDDATVADPLDVAAYEAGYDVTGKSDHLNPIMATIIQIGLSLLGVTFILLMLYGGFLWMTDQGNEQQVAKAKNLIISALIGLVIVASAYAISWFIVNALGQGAVYNPDISE